MKNKRGWLKIMEAFIAVVLITSVVLIVMTRENVGGDKSFSNKIYDIEISILRTIQLNESLRDDVLNDFVSTEINNTIYSQKPEYMDCDAKICDSNIVCELGRELEKDIYVQSTMIAASLSTYNPKQLKLFCWER